MDGYVRVTFESVLNCLGGVLEATANYLPLELTL